MYFVTARYLANMEVEDSIANRRIYSRNLTILIDMLGVTVVRHLDQLLSVIGSYMEICDGDEETSRVYILNALYAVLHHAWPRISGHADVIMKALVRILCDLATEEATTRLAVKNELKKKALDCVVLLRKICPEYDQLDDQIFSM